MSGSQDKTLKLWDLETGVCLRTFDGHTDEVTAVALVPERQRAWLGRHALSGSRDKTLKLWDIETGACLRTFDGHTDGVTAVAPLPDGRRTLSGDDQTLKLWDIETGACLATWQAESGVKCCAASSDIIVAGTKTGEVLFLKVMPVLSHHSGRPVPARR